MESLFRKKLVGGVTPPLAVRLVPRPPWITQKTEKTARTAAGNASEDQEQTIRCNAWDCMSNALPIYT